MKSITVKALKREVLGKKETKKLRANGIVPGVLYGMDRLVHIAVPFSELRKLIYTPDVYLIDLDLDGEIEKAIIQDTQWHPVEEQLLHIDFFKIEMDKPVKINLPLRVTGMAKGIKAGGRLKTNMRRLKVKALPKDLPDTIEIDVTSLDIGDSIKVGELQRDNLRFLDNKSNLIVGIVSTRMAQAAAPLPEDLEVGEEAEAESQSEQSESEE